VLDTLSAYSSPGIDPETKELIRKLTESSKEIEKLTRRLNSLTIALVLETAFLIALTALTLALFLHVT
jgi:hypothetical protein